ncbi:MAG: GGDEF domain-containing protein, partial [Candidatus Nanopelagicales bacterium]
NIELIDGLEAKVLERTVALAEANRKLSDLSLTDDLTGLNNRRGFFEFAAHQRGIARHEGHASHIAFFDVDGLKKINDSLGHNVGDAAISEFAEILKTASTAQMVIARLGGDEFVALISEPDDTDAAIERVRELLRIRNADPSRSYQLEVSVGVAACDQEPIERTMSRADDAMYIAKQSRGSAQITAR